MRRIKQGWELTKKSWSLLRGNRELAAFPIYGTLAALAVTAIAIVPGLYLIDTGTQVIGAVLTAIGLYLTACVGIYFGVGLAAAADASLHGRQATLGTGLAVANQRLGAIAGWAAVSALVGLALSALQSTRGGAAIVGALVGTAWSLITFLAVPVICVEGTGPFATLKRSATIFKQRWAGQVTGNVAIGGIVFVVGVLPAVVLIALGAMLWAENGNGAEVAGGAVVAAIGVALLVISLVIVRALQGIFGVVLYRFAVDGEASGEFTADELESAVRAR